MKIQSTLLVKHDGRSHSPSPSTCNAYLQGRYFYDKRMKEDLEKSIDYYNRALQMDPNYARAWAGLADTHREQATSGLIPFKVRISATRKEAEKALEQELNAILDFLTRMIQIFKDQTNQLREQQSREKKK
jgi:tetratricopeptide (TPR) repeat protein